MLPNINQKQLQQAMKKMGMKQEEIPATEVIIKTPKGDIIIKEPEVSKVNMMGQESFQISGKIVEQDSVPEITEDDVKTVMEQAHVDYESAKEALIITKGDIAQAIMGLRD